MEVEGRIEKNKIGKVYEKMEEYLKDHADLTVRSFSQRTVNFDYNFSN